MHFIRSSATKVQHINNGKVTPFAGGYDYYLEKSGHKNARAAFVSQQAPTEALAEFQRKRIFRNDGENRAKLEKD